jgi:peptidyl-dipeptidase Dcp
MLTEIAGGGRARHAVAHAAGDAPLQNPDAFETEALEKTHLALALRAAALPLQLLLHIWATATRPATTRICGARCSTTTLPVVLDHGGHDARQRRPLPQMVLSRGNTEDLGKDVRGVAGRRAKQDRADAQAGRKTAARGSPWA